MQPISQVKAQLQSESEEGELPSRTGEETLSSDKDNCK